MQTCMSAVRTVSPALSSTIFALSVDKHALGGQLIWVTLYARALAETSCSRLAGL